jgi:hypothetical protein
MGALLIPVLIVLVLLVLGVVWLRRWGADRQRLADELNRPDTPTLEYTVPEGQDPAAVLLALENDGYVATTDPTDTLLVRVHCPAGLDRERARVRAVIETVGVTAIDSGVPVHDGPVRFRDEL